MFDMPLQSLPLVESRMAGNACRDSILGMYALIKCYLLSVLRDALSMLTASMSPQPLQ